MSVEERCSVCDALSAAKEEIERLRKWEDGIEYHLGSGQISCEEVRSEDGRYIGIQLRQVEQQPIGSDTTEAVAVPNKPSIVICVHNIESAVVLLRMVTKVCRFLTDPQRRAGVKAMFGEDTPRTILSSS